MSDFDYLIVGSGAAGAAAAWKLVAQGFKVACLERGEWMDPARYPAARTDWEAAKTREVHPAMAVRQAPADYPVDDTHSPIALCNFNAVGGSTILYSGHFPRFRPHDFRLASTENIGLDWPLSYADLQPFFDENEREMGAAGLAGDPCYPDIDQLLPPVPLGDAGTCLAKAFNAKDWHWWPSPAAISTRDRGGRAACLNLGPCNTGCAQGAKGSTDVTYIPRAQAKGLVLLTGHSVSKVLIEEGRAVGVLARDTAGQPKEIRARNVVLAASAAGTARILLNSASEAHPNGLANRSDQVGRNLMLHPLGYVEGVFEHILDTDVGPQGCMLYSLEFGRSPKAENGHRLGYMMHGLRGTGLVETALSAHAKRKLRFGADLYEDFNVFWRKQLVVTLICEDLPEAHNRITLDPGVQDSFGDPGIKVAYTLSENTKKMMTHGMSRARELMAAAGARRSYAHGPVRNSGWHIMGTARMGQDPETSVVNAEGRAHDVPGLYVVDSSVFVTGSCVNPANTIQALALYLADRIGADAKLEGAA